MDSLIAVMLDPVVLFMIGFSTTIGLIVALTLFRDNR